MVSGDKGHVRTSLLTFLTGDFPPAGRLPEPGDLGLHPDTLPVLLLYLHVKYCGLQKYISSSLHQPKLDK